MGSVPWLHHGEAQASGDLNELLKLWKCDWSPRPESGPEAHTKIQ